VWRADLPEKSSEEDWINAVTLCPPTSVEALAAPLYLVKQWLRRLKVEAKPKVEERVLSDVEGEDSRSESDKPDARKVCPPILLWRGPKKKKRQGNASGELSDARLESKLTADLDEIKPNDTIILPVKYGGWENFGHVLEPIDVAEAARWKAKREAVLRLHPAVLTALPEGEAKGQLLAMVDGEDKPEANELRAAFVALAEIGPEYFREWLTALSRAEKFSIEEHPLAGWAVTGKLKKEKKHPVEVLSALTDDDDDAASLVAPKGREVTLEEHVSGVTKYAVQFATQCGLPPELISVFELAGKFHDAGKADPRFQRWLYGCMGNMWGARSGKLLAKSTPKNDAIKWQAQAESGYPKGSRHEVLSVSLVQNHEGVKTLAQESKCDWDLILHLVASHHGHCRPFAPVVDDPQPADVKVQLYGYELTGASSTGLERLDSGIAERFWKLTRKYGWWGLAYLEAIFRLADHYQSHLDTGDL
ncbi:MAG TPA: CRISPR-associated endonuclease Cas3'', partial [Anaerolineales bacterium]|nr:CRISPR-associated endonuclease Cas3'' [Anaerolineales bacterium]